LVPRNGSVPQSRLVTRLGLVVLLRGEGCVLASARAAISRADPSGAGAVIALGVLLVALSSVNLGLLVVLLR
jgi:hypothetical protein